MARFVSSDQHYYHENILKYQPKTRLYKGVPEMNEELIQRHNAKVKPTDEVLYLGDFSFGNLERTAYVLSRLNGIKTLVLGNHDQVITKNWASFEGHTSDHSKFVKIKNYEEARFHHNGEDFFLVFSHYPMLEWNRGHHGSMMIHGHCHGNCRYPWPNKRRIFDAGVDTHPNNEPWAFEEIVDLLKNRPVIKHHN
jgi:calcineurin-like phosphoesterase family protein